MHRGKAENQYCVCVCEHSSPCHPEMQVKGLSGKEEAISEYNLQTSSGLQIV